MRTLTYQVMDQESPAKPTAASMEVWDSTVTSSPNNLHLTGYTTTCTGKIKDKNNGTNEGPCGVTTGNPGQLVDTFPLCSSYCTSNGACVASGTTVAIQPPTLLATRSPALH